MKPALPGDLSWTKFYIPVPRLDLVARPRLITRLEEGLTRPLALICAPAGYGKTTLLSHWAIQQQRPIAWLSLDQQDNDSIRFWTYAIAALQTLHPDLGQSVLDALQSPQPPPPMSVLPGLLDQIVRGGAPHILILDDYQFIHDPTIHETLAFCIDHLPPRMHVIIATRTDPPLPLARWRVRNQLLELRAADLRFTTEETAAFLNRMTGLTLPPEDAAALETRTEGWIASLQLAALALQGTLSTKGRSDVAGFVRAFTGSHVYVAEYLAEEVLQHQSEDVQTFLLQTAILDRLTAGLCEAITGRSDGQAVLTALQRANLFVIPLDNQAEWFRYHHLFADLLRARLRQTLPSDAITALHARAAAWYEQQGFSDEAIGHWLEGKDYQRAAALVETQARSLMFTGRINTLKGWLESLPEPAFQVHPRLTIYRVWIQVMQGKADLSEQAVHATDELLKALPSSPDNEQLRAEWMVIACRFIALSGNTSGAIRYAQEALKYLPDGDLASRARVQSALTIAYGLEGDLDAALVAYRECLKLALAAGYYSLAAHTTMLTAQGQVLYGRLHEAARFYQSIIDMGNQAGQSVFFPAGQGYIGLAEIFLEWNERETAERYLKQGMALCGQGGLAGLSTGYAIESRLHQAWGDFERALDTLHRLEQAAPRGDFTGTIRQIQIRLAAGDVDGAAQWAAPLMQLLGAEPAPIKIPLLVVELFESVVIRVLLAQGEIDKAMQLLDRLQATAEPGKRFGRLIDLYLLRALALQKQNGGTITPAALDCFEQALSLAEPEGYCLLFVEEGQAVIPLLTAAANKPTPAGNSAAAAPRLKKYARTLLNAFAGNETSLTSNAPDTADLIEPLTPRELEVLYLIAAGDSNQVIADKLVITVSAVKKHTGNIFGKLYVNSRTQAIARARQLGLFPPGD